MREEQAIEDFQRALLALRVQVPEWEHVVEMSIAALSHMGEQELGAVLLGMSVARAS